MHPRHPPTTSRLLGLLAGGTLVAASLACSDRAAPLVTRLERAAAGDGHEVASVARDLLHQHGEAGKAALVAFARAQPLLEYEPVHGVLVAYDSSTGRLRYEILAADHQPLRADVDPATLAALNEAYKKERGREWMSVDLGVPADDVVALHTFTDEPERVLFVLERRGGPSCFGLRATFEGRHVKQWTVLEVPHDDLSRRLAARAARNDR